MSPSFDFAQDIRKKPFALPVPGRVGPGRLSKGERFAQAPPQPPACKSLRLGERGFCPGGRASGSERTGLSKHEIDLGNTLLILDILSKINNIFIKPPLLLQAKPISAIYPQYLNILKA
jgi:hypothetical protein